MDELFGLLNILCVCCVSMPQALYFSEQSHFKEKVKKDFHSHRLGNVMWGNTLRCSGKFSEWWFLLSPYKCLESKQVTGPYTGNSVLRCVWSPLRERRGSMHWLYIQGTVLWGCSKMSRMGRSEYYPEGSSIHCLGCCPSVCTIKLILNFLFIGRREAAPLFLAEQVNTVRTIERHHLRIQRFHRKANVALLQMGLCPCKQRRKWARFIVPFQSGLLIRETLASVDTSQRNQDSSQAALYLYR